MSETTRSPLRGRVDACRDQMKRLAARHGSRRIGIFGSVARGEDSAGSDVDVLSDFESGRSFFDLMHLEDDLAALLGSRVDVVDVKALKPRDQEIRAEAIWL